MLNIQSREGNFRNERTPKDRKISPYLDTRFSRARRLAARLILPSYYVGRQGWVLGRGKGLGAQSRLLERNTTAHERGAGGMSIQEWHKRFVERLVQKANFTYRVANDIYMDGESHDYDDDPEDAADTEASYWRYDE